MCIFLLICLSYTIFRNRSESRGTTEGRMQYACNITLSSLPSRQRISLLHGTNHLHIFVHRIRHTSFRSGVFLRFLHTIKERHDAVSASDNGRRINIQVGATSKLTTPDPMTTSVLDRIPLGDGEWGTHLGRCENACWQRKFRLWMTRARPKIYFSSSITLL